MLRIAANAALGYADIELMLAFKCRLSALLVLTYIKYAALRVTENQHFRRSLN